MFYQMLIRLFLSVCGLGLADYLLDGIRFDHFSTLFWAALLLGVANTFVRPVLVFFTLPITVLTLGFFLIVINAAVLGLVAAVLSGFHVAGFWSALLAWLIVAVTHSVAGVFLGRKKS
ncbi:MAG: phage holin family protein [Moraxellaceae bacterium]|nr:phage holin family protein [Moraxellaceae bacterium]